ncbi:MAG: hypothetical protein BWY68_00951 [bacterium ADurb.Bin400]|nr:MAG: hypothetical protein BWY68_00951 [bacterium ADurb.Bin400]
MLTVNGDIVNDGKIVEFRPLRKIDLSGNNKAGFIIRFQNNGNVHLKPTGEIFINNIFGRKVATLRVNEDAGNVLPNSIRKFQIDWDKYNRFGRYTAQAGLIYGDGKSATGKTVFWVIPLKETLITIAVLLIIFRAIRRNTKKRK